MGGRYTAVDQVTFLVVRAESDTDGDSSEETPGSISENSPEDPVPLRTQEDQPSGPWERENSPWKDKKERGENIGANSGH